MNQETVDRPQGINAIVWLMGIGVFGMLFYAFTVPGYLLFAVFALPLWVYMIVGLLRGWKWARRVTIVVASVFLVLSLMNIAAVLFLDPEELRELNDPTVLIAKSVFRIVLIPLALWYLFTRRVRSFYSQSDQ